MSADDFQSKYASVMESMLKSAVAETTKLFETMVDELKAEISQIKKENEDLKTRCSQFENARNQPAVHPGESEPVLGGSDGSQKRDTAVQCDLVPFRMMLVEQCQPLRYSGQQCGYEERNYVLQEHNYETHGERNSQMEFMHVKTEEEEVKPTVVCGQLLSDKAGSPWASENEGPFIEQVCSTAEVPLPEKDEETRVALKLPCLGMDSGLQGAQNPSSQLEHSIVISLAAIKDDLGEHTAKIWTQGGLITTALHQSDVELLEKEQASVVPQQCQREGGTFINEQTDVTLQQHPDVQSTEKQLAKPTPPDKGEACDELKNGVAGGEASSQPDLPVRRRRGRPPKKKHLQQPVKELRPSPSSDTPTGQAVKNSTAITVEEVEVSCALDTFNIASSESPQASTVQPKESLSIVTLSGEKRAKTTLEDVENSKVGSLAVSVASSEKGKSSESRQCPMDMEEGVIQAPSTEVSSAVKKLNTLPAESPETPAVEPRQRRTSATLQDAMLLVEAMNQSTVENAFSPPQRRAAQPQTQCAPRVGTLQTVDEVPAEPQTQSLPVEAAGNLPITKLSTPTQSPVEKRSAAPQTTDASPTNKTHYKVVLPKQQHTVTLSSTTTSSKPSSITATQRSVQSLQQSRPISLMTTVAPSKPGNAAHKIIVVPRPVPSLTPHKITALSPTQIPNIVSVVAKHNNSILQGSAAVGLPLGKPSFSSVPQKTLYVTSRKSLPVVTSQSTTTSTGPQSGAQLHPKVTIIIPRPVSAVASMKHQSQTIVPTRKQESDKSAAPVTVSSSQLISSSQELLSASVHTQTTLDEKATMLSLKRVNTPDDLESPKQTFSVSETINALTGTCSSLNKSLDLVPSSMSPAVPLTFEQKLSAVVRLTRFPFPVSTKESVLVSELPSNGPSEAQSILKEDGTHEKPSPVVISSRPSERLVLSTDICPNLKDTSVAVSVNTSRTSEEPNDTQEEESLVSENCSTLEETPDSGYGQSSTPSSVSAPVLNKSKIAIDMTGPSAVSGTAGLPASNSNEEIISMAVQDCVLPIGPPIEGKQSAGLIHLTSITSKDISDPHSQMTKAQFLAQLAVSPVVQDPKNACSTDSVDAEASGAETSTSDKKTLQRKSLVAQLRSHLKTHLQARRKGKTSEPHTETETCTGSPKKPRLENDSPNHKSTSSEPIPVSPKTPGALEEVAFPKKTTIDPTSIRPKRTVGEQTYVSSRRSKAASESTSVSHRRSSSGRDGVGSKNEKPTCVSTRRSNSVKVSVGPKKTKNTSVSSRRSSSVKVSVGPKKTKNTSVSPRRSSSVKESVGLKKTKNTSVSPRRSSSVKVSVGPKKAKNTSVSPRRSSSVKESVGPKKTKSTSVSPRRSSSTKESASPKKTKNTSVCPRNSSSRDGATPKNTKTGSSLNNTTNSSVRLRTSSSREAASPKKTQSTSVSPKISSLSKNGTSVKMSINESTSYCRRSCTLPKDSSSTDIKRESNCFSPRRCSITTDGASIKNTESETGTPRWPKLANDGVKPRNTGESTPKRPRLIQDGTSTKRNLRVVNAKKLAKAAKAKTMAKIKNSSLSKLQNEAKTSQLAENLATPATVKRCKAKAVWTPPKMPASKTSPAAGRTSLLLSVKKETRSQSDTVVYPPSVSLHPIPLKGPTIISPLQPLSVIGRRLLKNQCGECGRILSSGAALESHVSLHTGNRPFSCALCGKRFPDSKGLKRHGRVHRNGRIHVCQQCGKGFVYRFGLTKHLQMVHGRIKPFVCQICNKGFFTKRDVEAHIRIHTGEKPFHCNLCEKKFARRVELNVHLRWHNGEKRHWCPYCGKGFLDFNNLKRHKYIHTGEKPHSCPHCSKSFTQSGHLKKHVKNVHKIQ